MRQRDLRRAGFALALSLGIGFLIARTGFEKIDTVRMQRPAAAQASEPRMAVPTAQELAVADSPTGGHVMQGDKSVHMLALEYRSRRDNIRFDEKQFLAERLAARQNFFTQIGNGFHDIAPLLSLANEDYYITRPKALMERMAMMDMLRGFFEHDLGQSARDDARRSLLDILDSSIPRNLPEHVKKILASEKYDAMRVLAQYDPESAYRKFNQISNEALKQILTSALQEGIAKSTIPEKKLEELKTRLAI